MDKESMMQYRRQVGIQFRMQRETQGWSVEQVATMADMKQQTVEKIEAGVFNVPIDVLSRLADVLGVTFVLK